ncbi:MAG: tRNA-guanine transglycosylase, partial [Actinobacteria bacterium]|nr:tRNA-guanine transglycosylase [Actinomycetota bacterium]
AYLNHLFRGKEILASTLATIHNVHFIVTLVEEIRKSIIDGTFNHLKEEFLGNYKVNSVK